MAGDGSRGHHRGRHQMRACAGALAPAEIPVGGRCATLARSDEVAIDADAHRAAGFAPLETGVEEDAVETFFFGLTLDRRRARRHEARHLAGAACENGG